MPKLTKTSAQNRAIFGLGAKLGCSHEDLRKLAYDVTNERTDSIKALTFDEANGMIRRLGGRAFDQPNQFTSRRTENYHKQKAGIKTIVTVRQKGLIERLIRQRNITADGERALCRRIIKCDEPRTTSEANKIIEALKAMNARDAAKKEAA